MGTTSRGYPYPEGSDYVASGDDAIEALAQAVTADITGILAREPDHGVVIGRADSLGAAGGASTLAFPGEILKMDGFTYDAGVLTYAGSPRTFIVDAEVQISGAGANVSSIVEVRLNGTAFAGSYDDLNIPGGSFSRSVTHRVTTPVRLNNGNVLDVLYSSSPTGTLDVCGLRVYPIGPSA